MTRARRERPVIGLNDGRAIPQLGFGVYQLVDELALEIVGTAIGAGYRSFDTAAIYGNERGVGLGLRAGGVSRRELFVTTKLWNEHPGFDETLRASRTVSRRSGSTMPTST